MKIITWNVNGIRAVMEKGFRQFVEEQNPDILCLQETKCHRDQLNGAEILPPEWKDYWSAAEKPGYSGTATFTRREPTGVQRGFGIPQFDAEGRMVVTEFPEFELYNVYFPNGGSGMVRHDFKQEFLRRFGHHLAKRVKAGRSVIVVGDYNVAYLDHDVYDPKALQRESGFLPEERRWMVNFLESGFVDGFRYFHPDAKEVYTWWAYYQNARVNNRGWRIDHICVSRDLEKRMKRVQVLSDQEGSDHCPVMMEIDL